MLFRKEHWAGLADGTITVAFRRWTRPTVRVGGTLRSPGGLLAIEAIDVVGVDDITEAEAHAAGHASLAQLVDASGADDGRAVHRIRFSLVGDDPRDALRAHDDLSDDELAEIVVRLDRLDRHSPDFAWARPVLELIAEEPGLRAADLAARLGCERDWLKRKVVRLKEMGLTISLSPGYRLSPRGQAVHRHLATSGTEGGS